MDEKPEIVRIKLEDYPRRAQLSTATKAFQVKIDTNKTVVVYNHIQGYILDALMKAVFANAH
ncbi:hypothetical protein [Lacticaseibacillus paracasei]|jgi:hypothetical protein|uniref:hypothetical protein n=1 Tax=Lacticaseibacillus paracasei TaxID=1597 RepID=UPI0026E0AADB|nr:hypothetical protein [Lacticaseibacillus paracasei]MDO5967877.1 hypothetical protein [Lacticaseibacillus paracasei]